MIENDTNYKTVDRRLCEIDETKLRDSIINIIEFWK